MFESEREQSRETCQGESSLLNFDSFKPETEDASGESTISPSPFMQSRRALLRPSCSASNAYNVSAALSSTFSSASNQNRSIHLPVFQSNGHLIKSTPLRLGRCRAAAAFCTSCSLRQESQQSVASSNSNNGAKRQRLGGGGTYANYESLTDRLALLKNSINNGKGSEKTTTTPAPKQIKSKVSAEPQKTGPKEEKKGSKQANKPLTLDSEAFVPDEQLTKSARERSAEEDWHIRMQWIANVAGQLANQPIDLNDEELIDSRRQQLFYYSRNIQYSESPMQHPMPMPWALEGSVIPDQSGLEALDLEIHRFAKFMELTPAEKAAREAIRQEIISFIKKTLGGRVRCEVFGSDKTGLSVATSDIDIRVTHNAMRPSASIGSYLRDVSRAMFHSRDFMCTTFRNAKYPIVNAQHRASGIDIQIVNAPSTDPQGKVTQQYLEEIPNLRELYLLLRTVFGVRGLVDVFNGGIGSYGLFIMLVASLKRRNSQPPKTAAEQLVRFLNFYKGLDTYKHGVSVTPPKLFKKHTQQEGLPLKDYSNAARRRNDPIRAGQWSIGQTRLYQPYLLSLQDPANPVNDLGRKTNAIKHIRRTAGALLAELDGKLKFPNTRLGLRSEHERSLLLPLVGRCHEIYYERRRRVEEYGLKAMRARNEEMEGRREGEESQQKTAAASAS